MLRKAFEDKDFKAKLDGCKCLGDVWKLLMLEPKDYSYPALFNKTTRAIMEKAVFEHGGKAYDDKYPEGIPTSV